MAAFVSASPHQQAMSLPSPVSPGTDAGYFPSSTDKSAKKAANGVVKEEAKPNALMLGHWHKRTWDLAASLNVDGRCKCFAAVTDMRDALVVLKAAIPAADLIICSSYYPLEDVQEMLLDYEGEINVLIAPPNLMNTKGADAVAEWAGNCIDARSYHPKTAALSPSGYMRRLSQTSTGSGSNY
ncbi:hypothetical protein JCM10207_006831 [Rhodosporidiobolus poonsookiae]